MTRTTRGFTLVEVLVAMAVMAIGMVALIQGAGDYAADSATLRDRTLARWVAANQLTELQLQPNWPSVGKSDGEEEMGLATWYWQVEVEEMEDPDLRQLTVRVRQERDGPVIATMQGFVGNPAVRGAS